MSSCCAWEANWELAEIMWFCEIIDVPATQSPRVLVSDSLIWAFALHAFSGDLILVQMPHPRSHLLIWFCLQEESFQLLGCRACYQRPQRRQLFFFYHSGSFWSFAPVGVLESYWKALNGLYRRLRSCPCPGFPAHTWRSHPSSPFGSISMECPWYWWTRNRMASS